MVSCTKIYMIILEPMLCLWSTYFSKNHSIPMIFSRFPKRIAGYLLGYRASTSRTNSQQLSGHWPNSLVISKKWLVSLTLDLIKVTIGEMIISLKCDIFSVGQLMLAQIGQPGGLMTLLCILGNMYQSGVWLQFWSKYSPVFFVNFFSVYHFFHHLFDLKEVFFRKVFILFFINLSLA